jgi:hypothetical protein
MIDTYSRRAFLARIGVLGAAAGAGTLLPACGWPVAGGSGRSGPSRPAVAAAVPRLLADLARDTLDGLVAFVVPGSDRYSRAQGTPRTEPGAIDARATDFMIEALDSFVPFPDELARPAATALATGVSGLGIDLPGVERPGDLPGGLLDLVPIADTLDDVLGELLVSDETIPLSLVVALLLNLAATQVDPLAVSGPFLSPFARLGFAEKAATFALLEGPDADLVAALDTRLPEPLRASVSGVLRFVAGALLEFPAFATYNEWAVLDPATRQLRATPVGWTLTGYGGVSDGWDELLGYYQERTEVRD